MTYTGTGITGPYPYTFRIFAATDLVVKVQISGVETTYVNITDYTVDGVGSYNGGNVNFTSAVASGALISLERRVPLTQGTDLRNQGAYYAETVEDSLDRVTMETQQLSNDIGLSIKIPATESALTTLLPTATNRANKAIVFDASGNVGVGNTLAVQNLADPGSNGILSRTALNTTVARTLTAGDTSITITNGTGVSANPTIAVASDGVTYAKIQNVSAASRLLGRGSAGGAGDPEELTVAGGLSISGTVLSSSIAFWSKISNATELTITATGSATLNRMHVVSGTSADYDITISGLSPTAGDVVGFRVKDYSAASKQFRLDAGSSGSPKIAGRTRYLTLLHTNVVLLQWDGTDWQPLVLNLDTPWITTSGYLVSGTTITAVTTNPTLGTNSANNCSWSRSGDKLFMQLVYIQTGAGTAGSGNYLYTIPIGTFASDVEVDTSALTTLTMNRYAIKMNGFLNNNTTANYAFAVPYNTTKFRVFYISINGAGTGFQDSAAFPFSTAQQQITMQFDVHMTDW
jgi:hypothetical protein